MNLNTPTIYIYNKNELTDIVIESIINKFNTLEFLKVNSETITKKELNFILEFAQTKPSSKSNKKALIFYNSENLNKSISNALLKFLENIPEYLNVYFLTKNINKILITIKSRCIFEKYNSSKTKEIKLNNKWDKYINNLIFSFDSLEEINTFINSKNSNFIFDFINLYECKNQEILFELETFKKLEYKDILIILKLLSYFNDNNNILEIINNIVINNNKTLIFYKIIENKIL